MKIFQHKHFTTLRSREERTERITAMEKIFEEIALAATTYIKKYGR